MMLDTGIATWDTRGEDSACRGRRSTTMLDAYIIEHLRRREREQREEQPVVDLPVPLPDIEERRPTTPDDSTRRGVVIIPLTDDDDEEAA